MALHIEKVTAKNRADILALSVAASQEGFIETTAQCLQEEEEDARFIPVGLYVDEVVVGFAMYGQFGDEQAEAYVWLDRLLIDAQYQGKGYGQAFLQMLVEYLQERYATDVIYLSVYPNNTHAIRLYERFGFMFNGEVDPNGELLMVKDVRENDNGDCT